MKHSSISQSTIDAATRLRSLVYRGMGEWRTPGGECLDSEDVNNLRAELASTWLDEHPEIGQIAKAKGGAA